ncbi:MAG: glycoside hydrolase [Phycisphaerales bacterium]|nr:glycoside hydrolase [Phycisphaerales bacterium]
MRPMTLMICNTRRAANKAASAARPLVEAMEPRRLLTAIADATDLFGPGQTANASSTYPSAAFAAPNVVDGTNAAFLFNDVTGSQRLAISNFNASINTLRFFDTPSYTERAALSVTVYYSPFKQLALTPASYTKLGTFPLPTNNVGGAAQGDVYQTPTSPADHPRAADPSANTAAIISYDQIAGLAIPGGTQSILLDFGTNPAGLGFGLSEIQALGHATPALAPDPTLLAWGQNVYQKTNASLKAPGSNLYSETAALNGARSGGDSGFAYVWPESVQFRVLDDLVLIDPATYTPVLRAFSDELYARYWQNSGAGGYRSGVSSGATLFYDDNGHVAVALAEAYSLTGDPVYLSRAIQTYQFVISGEDSAGGGGIYFSVPDHSSKDAISTLQGVRAALLLYQLTGQSQYLNDASRLYAWAATHIQQPNGLFKERFLLSTSAADGFTLINSAGIGLSSNLLFYDVTGNVSFLNEAQTIAHASVAGYFNAAGAINDEGFWDFELVDALNAMYRHDHDSSWLNHLTTAMTWLHTNREDPNGHYGTLWARETYTPGAIRTSWNMIDQAAVAESYLRTAITDTVAPTFLGTQIDDGNRQRSVVRSLTFSFSAPVTLSAGAITLALLNTAGSNSGTNDGTPPTNASAALGTPTTIDGGLTWVVPILHSTAFSDGSGSLLDGVYTATVHVTLVADAYSQHLTGGDQTKTFHRLYGDINGDKKISNADFTFFSNAFGSSFGDANYNRYFDFAGLNGKISNADFTQFSNRFGKSFVYIG